MKWYILENKIKDVAQKVLKEKHIFCTENFSCIQPNELEQH